MYVNSSFYYAAKTRKIPNYKIVLEFKNLLLKEENTANELFKLGMCKNFYFSDGSNLIIENGCLSKTSNNKALEILTPLIVNIEFIFLICINDVPQVSQGFWVNCFCITWCFSSLSINSKRYINRSQCIKLPLIHITYTLVVQRYKTSNPPKKRYKTQHSGKNKWRPTSKGRWKSKFLGIHLEIYSIKLLWLNSENLYMAVIRCGNFTRSLLTSKNILLTLHQSFVNSHFFYGVSA